MTSNMFRSKRGHSVTRAELTAYNRARDQQADAQLDARLYLAQRYNTTDRARVEAEAAARDANRAVAERARKAEIRMLADNIEHLKMLTRGGR